MREGHLEAVELFLAAGKEAHSGLQAAVESGQAGSLALLASHPSALTIDAARAMVLAEAGGRPDLVDVLKQAGVTLDTPGRVGETALMAAVMGRHDEDRAEGR